MSREAPPPPSVADRRFAALLTAGFAVATLPRLLLHELWRDEAWLWLVVGESRTSRDLLGALERTGQGYLFPLLCDLVRGLGAAPLAMQLLHLALASAGVWVFARWAPAGRLAKVLFVCGYFPFYEYAVLSRHYAAGVLLLWLACAAARRPGGAPLAGAALGLLCQTTVYGYILAVAAGAGIWVERRRLGGARAPAAAGLALAMAGGIAGLVQLIPSTGTSFAPGWRLAWSPQLAGRVLRIPWAAFVPLPPPIVQFWNANFLDGWPRLEAMLGAACLLLAFAVLWPRRAALVTFGVGAAGLLGFGYVKLLGQSRYEGHLWLLLVAASWLGGGLPRLSPLRSWRAAALLVLALAQAGAAFFASAVDWRHPFSNAEAAAAIVRREGLADRPLLGHREPPAASVALAVGRALYSPSRGVYATHPDWGPAQREMGEPELRCAARRLAEAEQRDVVLVFNHPVAAWPEVDPVGVALGAIVRSEDYWIYLLRFDRLGGSEAAGCAGPPGG